MVGDIYLQLTSQINKENILVQNKLKIIFNNFCSEIGCDKI